MPSAMQLFEKYKDYVKSERVNDPAGYIEFLRHQNRFKGGALENLPKHAIILHDARVEEHLVRLGYSQTDYRCVETGTTDPNLIFVVYGKNGDPDFMINRGLPGTGGISTQAAELGALGAENLVHIGTCGLVGDEVSTGEIVISRSAYKDGGAVLLSDPSNGDIDPLAYPDDRLTEAIEHALESTPGGTKRAVGFTIPIFYFQPSQLIIDLITGEYFPSGPRVGYFEMEEASFFQLCKLMGKRAASMVVGSDRYFLKDGELSHQFEEDFDQDEAKVQMIRASLSAFKVLAEA